MLNQAEYTAVDFNGEVIASARQQFPSWAARQGYDVQTNPDRSLSFSRPGQRVRLHLVAQDVFDFIAWRQGQPGWDLLVAHAFLDLIDIPSSLPTLFQLCNPGGYFYFTINFDGATLFEPVIDPAFDELVQTLYHRTMDRAPDQWQALRRQPQRSPFVSSSKRCRGGDHRRRGLGLGCHSRARGYPQDEAYFLHYIIETVRQALAGQAELDASRFERWIDRAPRANRAQSSWCISPTSSIMPGACHTHNWQA